MSEVLEAPARPAFANLIGGEWSESRTGRTYEKRSPNRPTEVIGEFPASGAEDVDAAVAAATEAFRGWADLPIAQRGAFLTRAAAIVEERVEEIAQDMTLEMGKPIRESRIEAARAASIFRYFAGEGWRPLGEVYEQSATGQALYTVRRPLGVVGLITPWNFPCAIPAWKLTPAHRLREHRRPEAPTGGTADRAAPCLVPRGGGTSARRSERARRSRLRGRNAARRAPRRARDLLHGLGRRRARKFGSERRGAVRASSSSSAATTRSIVMPDADLDKAVEAAYAGAFWAAGQKCTATRRIYVHESLYDDFRDRLVARIERGKVGDPTDGETEVGPVVTEKAMDEILAAIERGKSEGGRVVAGGERLDDESYLVAPTLFEDVADDAYLSCEEVFGPVTSLYRFQTLDEALERANAVEYGLTAGIFTRDLGSIRRFVREAEAGILKVNQQTPGAEVHVPFGGIKGSGFGPHEQGRAALEFYTEVVTVYQDA